MQIKKNIKDALIIVLIATIIAIIYNLSRNDSIPFVQMNKEGIVVDDSVLFNTKNKDIDSVIHTKNLPIDTTSKIENNQDSIIKQDTIIKKTEQELASKDIKNKDIDENNDFLSVSYEQMLKIIESNDFTIIDARHPEQFKKSHIKKAINIYPLDEENIVIEKILSLPSNKTYIIYCDGANCDLSHELAILLRDFGFSKLFLYTGGWNEWSKKRNL
ncbi:MAG: rhodanese-like domain-containing protein [Ignavibacteria bacterium]|jgi:rhodanese-related sulfurtransferase|nr:rhodanese-like domain-containing protein [Ignavibacteria bacterium]